jgi:TrmH family RNA methyltransferase
MLSITSLQNPHIKAAVRLRERRHREKQGQILIDGARELRRGIEAGLKLIEVFVCQSLCRTREARQLAAALPSTGATIFSVTEQVFAKLAFGDRAEGVLGVAAMPELSLDRIRLPPLPLVAVLEGLEKPGNLGAVLRSADAAGVSAVIAADPRTDLYNPNAIRSSLGTIFTMPVAAATTSDTLAWLQRQGLKIFAARVDGSALYTQVDFRVPAAVVLGSEALGLTAAWSSAEVTAVRLPMQGVGDSLNVSAAAAVLFYEVLRQRSSQDRRR